jgi:hypothetical protein
LKKKSFVLEIEEFEEFEEFEEIVAQSYGIDCTRRKA